MLQKVLVYIAIVLKCGCMAVGVPINVWQLVKICNYSKRHGLSRYLYLKLQLGCSDLMILFFYCGSSVPWLLTRDWQGGLVLCKLVQSMVAFSFYLNSFMICCIACERWMVVKRPQPVGDSSLRRAFATTGAAYALALLLTTPQFYFWGLWATGPKHVQCTTIWLQHRQTECTKLLKRSLFASLRDNSTDLFDWQGCMMRQVFLEKLYTVTHLCVVCWIPVAMVVCCNCFIKVRLRHAALAVARGAPANPRGDDGLLARRGNRSTHLRRSTVRDTLLLSSKFVISWLPYSCTALIHTVSPQSVSHYFFLALYMTDVIVVSTLANPFIYKMPPDSTRRTPGQTSAANSDVVFNGQRAYNMIAL